MGGGTGNGNIGPMYDVIRMDRGYDIIETLNGEVVGTLRMHLNVMDDQPYFIANGLTADVPLGIPLGLRSSVDHQWMEEVMSRVRNHGEYIAQKLEEDNRQFV